VQDVTPAIPRLWPFKRLYYGWAIVATGLVASFGMVPMFGPVLGVFITPMQEELGWSRATISFAFTVGSMTGNVSSFVFGKALDRYGSRVIVVCAGIIIALAMLGMSVMQEPWQFWLALGAGRGSALAGIQIGISVTIANWFVRKRGRAVAVRSVGLRAGQAIIPMVIFAIMAVSSWRVAFAALAGFTALTIIVPGALYLRRRPEDLGLHPDGDAAPREAAPRTGGSRFARTVEDVSWTLAQARRTRAFWLLVAYMSVDRFALGAINLHLVSNFSDKGLPDALAVSVLSIFAATSAVTGVPWGLVLDRLHVRYGAMLMSFLLLCSMLIIIVADSYLLAVAFALTFGLAAGGSTVIENMLYSDYFGRRSLGAIRGFTAPFRLFAPLGPTLTGFIQDSTGSYTPAFWLFGGVFAMNLVLMSLARPPRHPGVDPQGS
jgi:sugar phosphate permease